MKALFNDEQKVKFRATYETGVTLAQLSKDNGVSIPTMSKYVRQAGGTLRDRGRPSKQDTPVTTPPVEETTPEVIEKPEDVTETERPGLFPMEF